MGKHSLHTKAVLIVSKLLTIAVFATSQTRPVYDNTKGFFDYKKKMNAYYQLNESGKRPAGYKQWKRMEWYFSTRVGPHGEVINQQQIKQQALQKSVALKSKIVSNEIATAALSGSWSLVGPTTVNTGNKGIGRVNRLAFVPTQESTIFAATAGGGLWKTTNGGISWLPLTDGLPNLNISDVVVAPDNPSIIYIATGDADGGGSRGGGDGACCSFGKYSTGVLKSTDGGNTWYLTGLKWPETDRASIYTLKMHPTNSDIVFAAGNQGIFRSTNAGASWTKVFDEQLVFDLEFAPNNSAVMYAAADDGKFYRSTDGGVIWRLKYESRSAYRSRVSIAVTPDNPNAVYMLIANSGNIKVNPDFYAFNGLYYSGDQGESWFQRASKLPNVFSGDGTDLDGRQERYDHALAVNPSDVATVCTGGIIVFRSTNGGTTLNAVSGGEANYHVDVHDLVYAPWGTLFAATDGGVYRSNNSGASWIPINGNLSITQYYRISTSTASSNIVLGGSQDNGSHLRTTSSSVFELARGGDGLDNAISRTIPSIMFVAKENGAFYRSTNSGNSFADFCWPALLDSLYNIKVQASWLTPIALSPDNPNLAYIGYKPILKAVFSGLNWTFFPIGNNNGTDTVSGSSFTKIAPSNQNIVYAGDNSYGESEVQKIWRTTNAGNNWLPRNVPFKGPFTSLAINPDDSDEIFLCYGGYTDTSKVYHSLDGGITWKNITGSLPNIPVNCILYANNNSESGDAIYIGTDVGVFYKDNALGDWIPFSSGLPVVEVTDLEIAASSVLRAGTYGRGIWESPLYSANCLPSAIFSTNSHPHSEPFYISVTNSILSTANIIGAGAHVQYKAGTGITLNPNFRIDASNGAKFVAYIGPCPDGGVPPGYSTLTANGMSGHLIENKE